MSDKRQNNQLLLAFAEGDRSEAPEDLKPIFDSALMKVIHSSGVTFSKNP